MLSIWDRIPVLDEVVAQIDAVTVETVRSYAGAMSDGAPAAMVLYGPVSDAPDIAALQTRLVA